MKTLPGDSAFATTPQGETIPGVLGGLTKREYFAAMAMQGVLTRTDGDGLHGFENPTHAATWSVEFADALIEALNAEKKP